MRKRKEKLMRFKSFVPSFFLSLSFRQERRVVLIRKSAFHCLASRFLLLVVMISSAGGIASAGWIYPAKRKDPGERESDPEQREEIVNKKEREPQLKVPSLLLLLLPWTQRVR